MRVPPYFLITLFAGTTMSLCSVEIHRRNDGLRARCIKVVEEERGGDREGERRGRKENSECQNVSGTLLEYS